MLPTDFIYFGKTHFELHLENVTLATELYFWIFDYILFIVFNSLQDANSGPSKPKL